ncbi:MAG TPA: RNA polymerase sigma factor [Phycisphaerae bacterium]|nr:RNA polymerase sigma factor [Phycisphaerae bacterium]
MSESHGADRLRTGPRGAWRSYIDQVEGHRAALHRYCVRLAGNVWDGEDLAQDALMRVFCTLARSDGPIERPRAYLIRTATNLWIDQARRAARMNAVELSTGGGINEVADDTPVDGGAAVDTLFQTLHPQERAAIVMKEALDMSLSEISDALQTSVGAVKSALSRARGRLEARRPGAAFRAPPRELVMRFMRALSERDIEAIRAMCAETVEADLVGGATLSGFRDVSRVFRFAHLVMPRLGLGSSPWWDVTDYEGEAVVVGYRTLDGVEGLNEVHRIDVNGDQIVRIRIYCFCPETLAVVAEALGRPALPRPHRSPGWTDLVRGLLGVRPRWRRGQNQRPH